MKKVIGLNPNNLEKAGKICWPFLFPDYLFRMKELRNYIRKLLEESMQKDVLEEDYESIKEIKVLANDILLFAARENIEYVKRQLKDGKIEFLYPVKLIDVYQEDPRKFPTLQNFLINAKIVIEFAKGSDSNTAHGSYTHINEPEYDETRWRRIILYPRERFFDDIAEKVQGKLNLEYKDIYFTMWYAFHSTLEHELQHAYDDYRSKSKIFQNKRVDKYSQKYYLPSGRENWPQDPKLANDKYTSYLKLQHEIWARFTQAVNDTRFTTADFGKTPDGLDYVSHSIKPIDKVIKDFQSRFHGWNAMSDDTKRRMLRRVSSYWHKEKEGLDKKNQDSINKAIEYEKNKELAEIRKTIRQTLLEGIDGMSEYKKWKKNNVMVRGISSDSTLDVANGSGARFGSGLYMAPLSNKVMAKNYGTVYFVVNGKPKNPKVFKDANLAEIWIQQNLIFNKWKNSREFEANTSIKDEMLKLGYDGIEIKGRETVNFTPEDVRYYSNENQLIQHYEHYVENQVNETLQEDYPSSFNMEYFKSLKSFAQRIKYCEQFLQRISSGSSRIVYKIDDEKVLKLAKNVKGLSQNEVEISYSQYNDINYICAKVFDYEDNNLWLEMEFARKVSKGDFKRITGFSFEDYCAAIHNYGNQVSSSRSSYTKDVSPEIVAQMWENEFMYPIFNFIGNYDIPVGDLQRLSSYGIVQRDGVDAIVLVDFGLNKDVQSSHYLESVEPTEMIDESNDTNLWVYGGIVLIKGKEVNGLQNLYACHIISLMELPRTKVDNTPSKSARMVVLDSNIFRIINDNGQLRALKVDWKTAASLSRTINFNGRQSHAVTLNNNKTPLHWEALKYNNFPQLFNKVGMEIMSLPGIKLSL